MKLNALFLLLFITLFITVHAKKVTVTTSPQTARIYVNGVLMGSGKILVTIPKKECVTVEIRMEGYIQETRTYCSKKGITPPPGTDYIQLQQDESYTSSLQSDIANTDVLIHAKPGKSREEAWKQIVSTVLGKFDVLENNDERAGYLRTSWNGSSFKTNTVRIRLIVKQASEDPLAYKIKFVFEESGKPGTAFNADELYHSVNRLPKKYDGFMEEITTKLKN
ncbi:MAG: hypothetical protein H7Y03_05790 [Chitinophagaceae bacterium]|nr:hypothetical protein [Chitinophagaceae bacterium]